MYLIEKMSFYYMSWEYDLGITIAGATIGASIPVGAAIKGYFYKINATKQRNTKAILEELRAVQSVFQGDTDLEEDVLDGNSISYYRVTIPVISFTGVLNSGGMPLFEEDLMRRLRIFYGAVEAHNHYYESIVKRREDLIINGKIDTLYDEIIGPYAESLDTIDSNIIGMLDVLIPQLENESKR